jgi:nucleoside 2-deoxyribosyltransferase
MAKNIFFIVPFRPGLNFMFLQMKDFIQRTFGDARCIRGDTSISTGMLIDKIKSNIQQADVVIADCSGGNPNVFYELGVAHALGKEVILIHDSEEKAIPTDIAGYERLQYGFDDDEVFCTKLKRVLQEIIGDKI